MPVGSSSQAPRAPRAKLCSDADKIAELLAKHIHTAEALVYRDEVSKGTAQPPLIHKHVSLLQDIRQTCGSITKLAAEHAFRKRASDMEEEWHLATGLDSWAIKRGAMLRAMLRDINQNLLKAKSRRTMPAWLLPFSDRDGAAHGTREEPPAEGDEDDEGEEEDEEGEEEEEVEPDEEEEEKRPEVHKKPAANEKEVKEVKEEKETKPSAATTYVYKWADYHKTAYRMKAEEDPKTAKRDYCLEVVAPDGSLDTDEAIAKWADGDSWRIPNHSSGDVRRAQRASSGQAPLWSGDIAADSSTVFLKPCRSKEKQWLILWHKVGNKNRQILQVITSKMQADHIEKITEYMKTLGELFVKGEKKENLEVKKRAFLADLFGKTMKRPAASSSEVAKNPSASTSASSSSTKRPRVAQEAEEDNEEEGEEEEDKEPEHDIAANDSDIDSAIQSDDMPSLVGMFEIHQKE